MFSRRKFLLSSLGAFTLGGISSSRTIDSESSKKQFNLWAFGDEHIGTDIKHGRESLAEAIAQSEFGGKEGGPPFNWDIAVDVGDMSGAQGLPIDDEGKEIIHQFHALKKHKREDIYDVCGNHDRSGLDEPDAWWWQKWIDPLGQHTEFSEVNNDNRPYKIEGTWERYSFRVGNILFLMMSDRNEPTQKIGRGPLGGNPGGVVSGETFAWWKKMVTSNPNSIIICVHHYVLKNTTVASGDWEGMRKDEKGNWDPYYHGNDRYMKEGAPIGASYLYWVDSKPDSGAFENYLEEHPGAVQIWIGGHTHTHPDDHYGGKTHIETKWGTHFINASCLTRYHGRDSLLPSMIPKSRLLTFTEGSDKIRVQCYIHTNDPIPQGWYNKAERVLQLSRPLHFSQQK
jgi:hypothetical protein